MNHQLRLIGWIALALTAGAAQASEQLSAKAGCAVCHATVKPADKTMIGPSYREIATRYKGRADAATLLAERVRKGGQGVWGKVPMAPTPPAKLADADLKTLVAWILRTP